MTLRVTADVEPSEIAGQFNDPHELADFLNSLADSARGDDWVDEVYRLLDPPTKEFLRSEVLQIKSFINKEGNE